MANHEKSKCYRIDLEEEEEEDDSCGSEGEYSSDDSDNDPSYNTDEEETVASFSKLSVRKKAESRLVSEPIQLMGILCWTLFFVQRFDF